MLLLGCVGLWSLDAGKTKEVTRPFLRSSFVGTLLVLVGAQLFRVDGAADQ